jgi:hypothetical protein
MATGLPLNVTPTYPSRKHTVVWLHITHFRHLHLSCLDCFMNTAKKYRSQCTLCMLSKRLAMAKIECGCDVTHIRTITAIGFILLSLYEPHSGMRIRHYMISRFITQFDHNRNHRTESGVPTTMTMNSRTFWEVKQPVTSCSVPLARCFFVISSILEMDGVNSYVTKQSHISKHSSLHRQ